MLARSWRTATARLPWLVTSHCLVAKIAMGYRGYGCRFPKSFRRAMWA
jgi:hypothetical protein